MLEYCVLWQIFLTHFAHSNLGLEIIDLRSLVQNSFMGLITEH